MKLSEIQPAVSMAGMADESAIIKDMKGDAAEIIGSVTPDHVTLGRVLWSTRADVVDHALAMRDLLEFDADPTEMTDDQVLVAIAAAESFISRARDYMGSKASCYAMGGRQHVAA